MVRALVIFCFIGWMAAMCGCDRSARRVPIRGAVTLDGQPLESGSILFSPLGPGPSAGGEIRGGAYELPADRGPIAGRYRVSISAWRFAGPAIYDEATGTTSQEPVSIIPARYNTATELEVNIGGNPANNYDFQLASQ